jgi:dihydrolipoamide dehydrogenase
MPENDLDLVIIGGGTGGYVAAIRAAQLGMRTVVVERDKLGGTCLHRGCIPTKSLLRSAEVYSTVRDAHKFGVSVGDVRFDWAAAMQRKQQIVDTLHRGVEHLMKKHRIEVLQGTGRIMGPSIFSPQAGAVAVETGAGSEILNPRYVLIATGSRPRSIPGLEPDGRFIVTSDEALQWTSAPASVLIIGAGAIGVEWASLLADVGVRVTLVEALPRVLPQEDEDVSAEIHRHLHRRGVEVHTGARVLPETLEQSESGVRVVLETSAGDKRAVEAACILVAVGRAPVIEDLGLEAADIRVERGAIVVDRDFRTNVPTIFAIGDVIGGLQLAHAAAHEGIHAVEVMAGKRPPAYDPWRIPRCTYCRPEVASIGRTEAQAKEEGFRVKVGRFPFQAVGKALVHGHPEGFVKIVADADTDDLLGVHMIGPHATDLIGEAALAQWLNATPWEVASVIHPHPTLAEALGEAALAVDGEARHI